MNKWISKEAIEEIGLYRVKNICAWCDKKMDIENYNIQLCRKCRMESLEEISKGVLNNAKTNSTREKVTEELHKGFASGKAEEGETK